VTLPTRYDNQITSPALGITIAIVCPFDSGLT
jgi:hypothetical protein